MHSIIVTRMPIPSAHKHSSHRFSIRTLADKHSFRSRDASLDLNRSFMAPEYALLEFALQSVIRTTANNECSSNRRTTERLEDYEGQLHSHQLLHVHSSMLHLSTSTHTHSHQHTHAFSLTPTFHVTPAHEYTTLHVHTLLPPNHYHHII